MNSFPGETPQSGIDVTGAYPNRSLDEKKINRLIHYVLDQEDATLEYVGVVLGNHEMVRELNEQYLDHAYNTDVLAFPMNDPGEATDDEVSVNGEIYVDLDTAAERAPEFDSTYEDEAMRYVVHGLLHLIGYTDEDKVAKKRMHELEDRYLRVLEG